MDRINIYYINITAEIVISLVLVFLLITCVLQRRRRESIRALIILVIANLLIMFCQIFEWVLMILSGPQTAGMLPAFYDLKKITYSLDYSLYYWISLAFYVYIIVHTKEMYSYNGIIEKETNLNWIKFLIGWGMLITISFYSLMSAHWFFYLKDNGNEAFNRIAYFAMYSLGTLATLSSVVSLIRDKKVLGAINFWLLMSYIATPTMFVIIDLISGTCGTYVLRAFFSFILYIHIELREEKLIAEKEARIARQEKELTELNTRIMLSQMQPHFLYNTLSTISGLCYIEGAPKAKHVVDKFSEYFRENLDTLGKERYINFEKELQHIKTYLWIEQVRFEEALNVEYDIKVSDFKIPSLSIQPIVENAVKHGIRGKKGGGTVRLETKESENEYQIVVSDDGIGYNVGTVPEDGKSHIGIDNIQKRLMLLCDGICEINSEPGKGTIVTVRIPKTRNEGVTK